MKYTNDNNKYFKVYPLKTLTVDSAIVSKLIRNMNADQQNKLIEGRTNGYAVPNDSRDPVVAHSRISGIQGKRPVNRAELVERLYKKTVLPFIKDNPDYVAGEEKYLQYRFSSRSVKLKFDAIADGTIFPYFKNAQADVKREIHDAVDRAIVRGEASVRKLIPKGSLRPLSFEEAAKQLPATTNGGMPYMVTGTEIENGQVSIDHRPRYISLAKKLAYNTISDQDRLNNSFVAIGRGQESNDTEKTIEGMVVPKQRKPGAEGHGGTILGARFAPGLEARKKDPRRAALVNQHSVDKVIHQAFEELKQNESMLAGDGSSYDTGMKKEGAMKIASVICDSFTLSPADRKAFFQYFDHVFEDPLVTPMGILGGQHGMPSGTYFTNELDSCYNEVLSMAVEELPPSINSCSLKLTMVTDQGDDAVMVLTHAKGSKEEVLQCLSECYNALSMSVNPKKQMLEKHKCEFLKRLHTKDKLESYRAYSGTYICMCNMEHAKGGRDDMYSARLIMQAANHYSNLPAFDSFMRAVADGDPLHLGVGLKGGCYAILQRAGGTETVLKRLGMASYATHLGVKFDTNEARLAESLSSAEWVAKQNKKLGKSN